MTITSIDILSFSIMVACLEQYAHLTRKRRDFKLFLFLGMYLGLLVAGVLGLDLLQAIFTTALAFHLGVVLTGLVMGLGSSPTHEVIQVLQNWKTNLKTGS